MLVLTRRTGEWLEFTVKCAEHEGPEHCDGVVTFRLKLTEFRHDRAKVVLDIPKEVEVKREGAGPKKEWPEPDLIDATRQRNQAEEVQDRVRREEPGLTDDTRGSAYQRRQDNG